MAKMRKATCSQCLLGEMRSYWDSLLVGVKIGETSLQNSLSLSIKLNDFPLLGIYLTNACTHIYTRRHVPHSFIQTWQGPGVAASLRRINKLAECSAATKWTNYSCNNSVTIAPGTGRAKTAKHKRMQKTSKTVVPRLMLWW